MSEYLTEELERSEADPQRLVIRMVPYGVPAQTPEGPEMFMRGAFSDVDITDVHLESQRHGGDIVGIGETLEDREDGAYATFRVSDVPEGRSLLQLVTDGVLRAASVVFKPTKSLRRADGTIERHKAELRRVAVLARGAYQGAQVMEVREDMTEETTTQEQPVVAPPVVAYDDKPLMERLDTMEDKLLKVAAKTDAAPSGERLQYRSWGELYEAVQDNPELNDTLERALADNTLAVSGTGLMGTANVSTIIEPVAAKRRTINAMGLGPLPAIGMSVDYIVFDAVASTGYQALVDVQATEKAEINSGLHAWDPATKAISTYAGGADNSWQLLQRSEPSFRNLLLRQYASEWAYKTNLDMVTAMEAGTNTDVLTLSGADDEVDAGLLRSKLIAQSLGIEAEVDSPANVVLCASNVFQRIAENTALFPQQYGTQNVAGTADAGTLNVNVSGLAIQHEPMLTAGLMLTSRGGSEVAEWRETFKGIVTQEVVSKLGTDIAIWGYGAALLYRQAGLYVTTVTLV